MRRGSTGPSPRSHTGDVKALSDKYKSRDEEKEASRTRDQEALESGEKTVEEVQAENGLFSFSRDQVRLRLDKVKRLS